MSFIGAYRGKSTYSKINEYVFKMVINAVLSETGVLLTPGK